MSELTALSRAYLALMRWVDGRSGSLRAVRRYPIDLELWWKCPELRGLDRQARMAVYYEFRREFETDPNAVSAAARIMASLVGMILAGCLVGGLAGMLAISRFIGATPLHSAADGAKAFVLFLGILIVGMLACVILWGLALRVALRRGGPWHHLPLALGPWGQRWRALVKRATDPSTASPS